jgi:hypothetical protein
VRTVVLNDSAPFTPLLIERAKGQTQLFVKEVKSDGKRYIVCRNTEAEKDKKDREAIVVALQDRLKRGDKALIGNSSYRRYLRKNKEAGGKQVFEIDAGKLADEAQFDGIFVLRTNAKITPLQAVLRCRDSPAGGGPLPAWQGPHAYAPSIPLLRRRHPRPRILHLPWRSSCRSISMISPRRLALFPNGGSFCAILTDSQQTRIQHNGKDWLVRSDAASAVTALFRQAGVAPPRRALQTAPPLALPTAQPAKRRRGHPRRSATSS